jgi:V8-like Glu-specific endopeptidase
MAKKTSALEDTPDSGLYPPLPSAPTGFTEGLSDEQPEIEYSDFLESLCGGTDDSQPVEQYDGSLGVPRAFVDSHLGPVAQIQWNEDLAAKYTQPGNVSGVRWGTGTMISADHLVTAGHLFDQTGGGWIRPKDNTTGATISPAEIALNMHVNFNFQNDPAGNPRAVISFPITALLEYRQGGLDYAICRIGGSPGAAFGINGVSAADAAVGDMLCIIGHPAGVPKRVEAGPLTSFDGNTLKYNDIDTLGGNSGSGVLQASTGLLVGVHTNGGCNPSGGANFGYRISAIRAVSPVLQALPAMTAPAPGQPPGPADPAELRAQYEAALFQLAQAIQQRSGELALLQQQYMQVLAAYQALISGQ